MEGDVHSLPGCECQVRSPSEFSERQVAHVVMIAHRCAVLGKPIVQSLSPVLHNAAYRALGLTDWNYGRYEVDESGLKGFLSGLDPSWAGLSLTMPLKRAVQRWGIPSGRWARRLGVANTAIFDWTGVDIEPGTCPAIRLYNTDVQGVTDALHNAGVNAAADGHAGHAMVIGTGSTALSALAALHDLGFSDVTVAARHPGKVAMLRPMTGALGLDVSAVPLTGAERMLPKAAVVISTLPAHAADPLARTLMSRWGGRDQTLGVLLDVIYDPHPSALIDAWQSLGGSAVGGERMLLYQAASQVALMTGTTADRIPVPAMADALRKALA